MADSAAFAPLTPALVRRAPPPAWELPEALGDDAAGRVGWCDDLRLFAMTWAAGFVFFLVFLA